jgi:hypothetical protein
MAHEEDQALIKKLGGPRAVSDLLGYERDGGVQRVQNWMSRGIPASIKLAHPDLFLPGLDTKPWDGVTERRANPPECCKAKPKAKKKAKKAKRGKK